MSSAGPDLKKYMDKKLQLVLNGQRKVGVMRDDQFMNVVLESRESARRRPTPIGVVVIRGNSIVRFEILDQLDARPARSVANAGAPPVSYRAPVAAPRGKARARALLGVGPARRAR